MQVSIDVDPANIDERKADDRGRITLGKQYADKTVRVAILKVDGEDDD